MPDVRWSAGRQGLALLLGGQFGQNLPYLVQRARRQDEGTDRGLHVLLSASTGQGISVHHCRHTGSRMAHHKQKDMPDSRAERSTRKKLSSLHKNVTEPVTHLSTLLSFPERDFILHSPRKLPFLQGVWALVPKQR